VAGSIDGEVIVLNLDAEEPHVLYGHDDVVGAVWISPDGDEIRSAGGDGMVYSWDVPSGRRVHAMPHAEFVEFLRAQTNMRAIPDVDAPDGYRITYDPFPGWAEPPPSW